MLRPALRSLQRVFLRRVTPVGRPAASYLPAPSAKLAPDIVGATAGYGPVVDDVVRSYDWLLPVVSVGGATSARQRWHLPTLWLK